MLGIGIGGMLGGWLADHHPRYRVRLYSYIELFIAFYGFLSLHLISYTENLLVYFNGNASIAAMLCILFLLTPTIFMGMTLPLLTMAFNDKNGSIGLSVGQLYFTNTLGAALGAWLVPFVLFSKWPLNEVILFAVGGNILVVACVLIGNLAKGSMTDKEVTA